MSDTTSTKPANPENEGASATNPEAQRKMLLHRANILGIKVSPNIGLDALRAKIKAAQSSDEGPLSLETAPENDEDEERPTKRAKPETEAQKRSRLLKAATRLIRIRVTCMNPAKKDLNGQIVCVANKYIGSVKKFVPFVDHPEGYHVPYCIYEQLRDAKFVQIRTKSRPGRAEDIMVSTQEMSEFAIEVLPPLSRTELQKLAQRQAMANGTAPEQNQ